MECHMMAIAARIFETYSAGRDHEREAAGFEQGFYGEADEKFDRLGPKMVRHQYATLQLADELEYNAAERWLDRHDRSERRRATMLSYVALAVSALSLVVTFLKK
jgi:hypothetical protein